MRLARYIHVNGDTIAAFVVLVRLRHVEVGPPVLLGIGHFLDCVVIIIQLVNAVLDRRRIDPHAFWFSRRLVGQEGIATARR